MSYSEEKKMQLKIMRLVELVNIDLKKYLI